VNRHARCQHKKYQLSCADYEALQVRAQRCCEICGTPGTETPHGFLVIDHDATAGDWAVRGLLCSRCNTMLDSHVHVLEQGAVKRYLSEPWYKVMLCGHGPTWDRMPEPSEGVEVRTRQGRVWRRQGERWVRFNAHDRTLAKTTWAALWRRHGPHLQLVA